MKMTFCISDILKMAEKLEFGFSRYYLLAAEFCRKPGLRAVYYGLARLKVGYTGQYAKMRRQLCAETEEYGTVDPDHYVPSHPQSMTGLLGLDDRQRPGWMPTAGESDDEILKNAVVETKDAIAFYRGLEGFLKSPADLWVIERIVNNEKKHLQLLLKITGNGRSRRREPALATTGPRSI